MAIKKPSVIRPPHLEEYTEEEIEDVQEQEVIEENITPKRRGRPPKKAVENNEEVPQTVKKRGRPPKNAREEQLADNQFQDIFACQRLHQYHF